MNAPSSAKQPTIKLQIDEKSLATPLHKLPQKLCEKPCLINDQKQIIRIAVIIIFPPFCNNKDKRHC